MRWQFGDRDSFEPVFLVPTISPFGSKESQRGVYRTMWVHWGVDSDRQFSVPWWYAQVSVNCSLRPAEAPAEAVPGCSSALKRHAKKAC